MATEAPQDVLMEEAGVEQQAMEKQVESNVEDNGAQPDNNNPAKSAEETQQISDETAGSVAQLETEERMTVDPKPAAIVDSQQQNQPTSAPISQSEMTQIETAVTKKDDKPPQTQMNATANVKNIPTRQYLDETIVPILLQALSALAKERPSDPIDFVAAYLLREKSRFQHQGANEHH